MKAEYKPTLADWTSILSISTRYKMEDIRSRSIKEISHFEPRINPVDQVLLAKLHDVPEWLPIAYNILCDRKAPIELDEASKLGFETYFLLSRAREAVRKERDDSNVRELDSCRPTPAFYPEPSLWNEPVTVMKKPTTSLAPPSDVVRIVNETFWPLPVPVYVPSPKVGKSLHDEEYILTNDPVAGDPSKARCRCVRASAGLYRR